MTDDDVRTRRWAVGAAFGVVASAPIAAWWLSEVFLVDPESVPAGIEPDVVVAPLPLTDTAEQVVGWAAVTATVVSVVLLVRAVRGPAADRRWLPLVGVLAGVGALVGVGWSWMTVPTIGANIGAGLYLLVAPPVAVGLVLWAVWRLRRLGTP